MLLNNKKILPAWYFARKVTTLLICLVLPAVFKPLFLRLLGHRIGVSCKIGVSFVFVDFIAVGDCVRIGHFNVISCRKILLRDHSSILHANEIRGPLSLSFSSKACLGNKNKVRRAALGVTYGAAILRLGVLTKVTAGHRIDCTRSVMIGNYSILAGAGSQIWTHGYVHHKSGPGRFRVDGKVRIGHNVYIGSASIISMGLYIADSVVIGSASSVSKSIPEQGLYVSQPLRRVEYEPEEVRARLDVRDNSGLVEEVYVKRLPSRAE